MMNSLRQLVESAARNFPDKTFCIFYDENRPQQITYREFESWTSRAGNLFLNLGVQKGDKVALLLQNSLEYLYCWFGLAKIGALMVPINYSFLAAEMEYILNHSESKVLVSDSSKVQQVNEIRHRCPSLQKIGVVQRSDPSLDFCLHSDLEKYPSDLRAMDIQVNDEASILYTSGTTAEPKGCVVDQEYYLLIGETYVEKMEITGATTVLTSLPLFHMNAQTTSVIGVLLAGATLVLLDRFHPATWWNTIRKFKPTFFHYLGVIPAILWSLPQTPEDGNQPARLAEGAGIPPEIHEAFEKRFNVIMVELYGSTEGGAGAIFWCPLKGDRKVGTRCFGRPAERTLARIVDDEDRDVPVGATGELLVRSADPQRPRRGMMQYYFKNPKATEEAWKGGWFHTGDYVKRDHEGFYYFIDRKKDIIRRSGENISASEIEGVLNSHPQIASSAAIAVPDPLRIEEIKIYVVLARGENPQAVPPEEIFRWCKDHLSYFKVPRYLEYRESLPRTSTEKIQKHVLKKERPDLIQGSFDRQKMEKG